MSVVLFYIRIFQSRKFRHWAYAVGAINLLFGVAFIFIFAFQCDPPSELWSTILQDRKHCLDPTFNVVYAILSIFIDVAILCMPWPMVWQLQLRTQQKFAVLSIFMLGGV